MHSSFSGPAARNVWTPSCVSHRRSWYRRLNSSRVIATGQRLWLVRHSKDGQSLAWRFLLVEATALEGVGLPWAPRP